MCVKTSRMWYVGSHEVSSEPGDTKDKCHHPCHHHHYPSFPFITSLLDNTYYTSSLSSGGRSSSFKCYHWVGCPRFFIFPVAEVASHVDGPLSCSVVKKFAVPLWDHIQHLVKSKFGVVGNISKYKSDLWRVFKLKCDVGWFPNKIWPQSGKEAMMMMIILRKMMIKNHLRWR